MIKNITGKEILDPRENSNSIIIIYRSIENRD